MAPKAEPAKQVNAFTHGDAVRRNLPTAEFQAVMREEEQRPVRVAFSRRNADLDPQLIWRGKYPTQDADLQVPAPPLYIQEKVHPRRSSTTCGGRRAGGGGRRPRRKRHRCSPTTMPRSTDCPTRTRRPSSTGTTPTGPTA